MRKEEYEWGIWTIRTEIKKERVCVQKEQYVPAISFHISSLLRNRNDTNRETPGGDNLIVAFTRYPPSVPNGEKNNRRENISCTRCSPQWRKRWPKILQLIIQKMSSVNVNVKKMSIKNVKIEAIHSEKAHGNISIFISAKKMSSVFLSNNFAYTLWIGCLKNKSAQLA